MPKKNDELEPVQPSKDAAAKRVSSDAKEPKTVKPSVVANDTDAADKAPKKPAKPSDKTTDKKVDSDKGDKAESTSPPEPAVKVSAADFKRDDKSTSFLDAEDDAKPRRSLKPRNWKSLAIKLAIALVAALALVTLVFGVLVYVYKSESSAVKAVSGVIPYPVEQVNSRFVPYSEYLFEVQANRRAYENNAKLNNQPAVDFKSAEGKKLLSQIKEHALDKLKSDAVVAQLASQKKVKVSNKEADELVNELYKRYGGKETLLKTLDQMYGWDISDLKKVVRKQLLAKKLQEKVTADPAVDARAKARAQEVLGKVKDNGDFAALAREYSQASDASAGGDLGQFTKGQLPDDVQKAVDVLQPGAVSDLVKTQYGYEIIKVTEKSGENTRASHILIKTVDFDEYFQEQLKKAKVKKYIKV